MTPNKTEQEKLGCKSSEFCDKHRFLAEAEHIRYAEQLLKLNKLLLGSVSIAKRFRGTERGDWRRGKHTLQLATKDSFVPGEFSLIVLGHYVQEKVHMDEDGTSAMSMSSCLCNPTEADGSRRVRETFFFSQRERRASSR